MNVLGLVGSPRKGSNTDLIVESLLSGAEVNKHQTEKCYIYDFEISPCIDCRSCKKGSYTCALRDDMTEIYRKIEAADVIIFGTPLYWYGPSAKMKLLLDRLRPYISSNILEGRKAILVIPSEEGAIACNLAVEMFKRSFKYLGIELADKILPKVYEKSEIKTHEKVLESAYKMGKNL